MQRDAALRLAKVDLNLLVALETLLSERSVTQAGRRLHLSQPAMSGTLARLRRLFDDPLVVRRRNVSTLTPFAESLIEPVRELLERAEQILRLRPGFDPATDSRVFTVIASDYVLTVLLAPLVRRLEESAARVKVNLEPIGSDHPAALSSDHADLLIMPEQLAVELQDFPSQALFSDRFVGAVWRGNASLSKRLTIEDLEGSPYLAFRTGVGGVSFADLCMSRAGVKLRDDFTTGSFAAVPFLLTGTQMLAVIQERFARRVTGAADIRLLELPVEMPPIVETMFWHPRRAFDPAHRWLRDLVAQTADTLGSRPA